MADAEDVHMNHQADMSLSPVYRHADQYDGLSDGAAASLHVCDGCVQSSDHAIYAHGGCVLCLLRSMNERLRQLERMVSDLKGKRTEQSLDEHVQHTPVRVPLPEPKPVTSPYENPMHPLRDRLFMSGLYDELGVGDMQQVPAAAAATTTIPQHHLAPLSSGSPTDPAGIPGTMWPIFPELMADLASLNENYESPETMHLRNLLNEEKEQRSQATPQPHDLIFTTTDFDTTIANTLDGTAGTSDKIRQGSSTGFTPPMHMSPSVIPIPMRPRSSSPIAIPARSRSSKRGGGNKPKFMFVNETSHHFVSNGGRPVSLRQLMNPKARKTVASFQKQLPKHTIIQYHPGGGMNVDENGDEDDGADIKAGEGAVHGWP